MRGHNEGTIYRRADGLWCAQVTLPGGRRKTKYAQTRTEVRAWLTDILNQAGRGLLPDASSITVEQYLAHWLTARRSTYSPNTYQQYVQIARDYIVPVLGRLRLQRLRGDQVQRLYAELIHRGIGTRTIRLTHAVLRRAMNQAIAWGLLQSNPTAAAAPPAPARREMRTLDATQVRQFLEAASDHRLYALFYLAITAGLRQGELLGLRWSDLDADKATLSIQRQVRRTPGQGLQFRDPKTVAGRRVVALGDRAVSVLREHRKRQLEERMFFADQWVDQGLVFSTTVGSPLDPAKVYRAFRGILQAAGLPQLRFHDLRHTAATLMLQQGVHPKVVQERLGHSSITITLDTYSHVTPGLQRSAADLIEEAIS